MKIAVVHDFLCAVGGSERVFQYICEEFVEADVFTLAYNPSVTLPYFSSRKIHTTSLNRFVRSVESFRWSFPIATYAMERLDFSNYDLVISSSATVAKYIKVLHGKHLCYCYIPTRALWQFAEYFGASRTAALARPFLSYLRNRDYRIAQRIDSIVAISEASKAYIKKYYNRDADVLHCPIDLRMFRPAPAKSNNFLIVSRLEHWKRVHYAIEAFNSLGLPLRIIGTGKEETSLRAIANGNITFLGAVDDHTLAKEYADARAVVFTPFLEYGLIPLEANASGTPVICYGKGGVTETMVGHDVASNNAEDATAVFFYEQTAEALAEAVRKFDKLHFESDALVRHARRWDVPEFKTGIRKLSRAVLDLDNKSVVDSKDNLLAYAHGKN